MYIKPSNDLDFDILEITRIIISRSWIIPRSHVLFEISKDTLNSNLPIFGWTSAATRKQIFA